MWDATTGQSLLEMTGHGSEVVSVGFSPDGRRIVTGSTDGTARVWDATTGQSLLELTGHTERINDVAFSPDGRRIVTGSWDHTARVWDAVTGQSLLELKGHAGEVTSVSFSPDGRRIATGSEDTTARVWEGRFEPLSTTAADVPPPTDAELARRRWIARPDPQRHARLAEQLQADPFARAVQLALEQQARGQLALESLDLRNAEVHFLNALLLKPKPHQYRPVAPLPRLVTPGEPKPTS